MKKRDTGVHVRLTADERAELAKLAADAQTTVAGLIRSWIRDGRTA